MGLVQVATNTITSAVSSVTLTGIDSDDVYMLAYNNVAPANDNISLYAYVTKSGTKQTDTNYDLAHRNLPSYEASSNTENANENKLNLGNFGTGTSETHQGIYYLYNFNSSSDYSFLTSFYLKMMADPNNLYGIISGAVHTVASASDGVCFAGASGNLTSGTFTMYRVV